MNDVLLCGKSLVNLHPPMYDKFTFKKSKKKEHDPLAIHQTSILIGIEAKILFVHENLHGGGEEASLTVLFRVDLNITYLYIKKAIVLFTCSQQWQYPPHHSDNREHVTISAHESCQIGQQLQHILFHQ